MGKVAWNKFTAANPNAAAFVAKVSTRLPNGPQFDKAGKQLPTPYALLLEWLNANLTDDWTAMAARGAIAVKVSSTADSTKLLARFPAVGAPKRSDVSAQTQQINYTDSGYTNLATELGYVVR